jgi:hypothetical protein
MKIEMEREKLMKKNFLTNALLATTFTIALALAGITTAQPEKGGEALVRLTKAARAVALTPATPATAKAHLCPTCKDTLVTIVDKATKGPNHEVKQIATHGCTACNVKIATQGVGKSKYAVATHTCGTTQTPALCCARN